VQVGLFQILVIALVVLVLFGRGRIGKTMGDVGEGVKRFREGLVDEAEAGQLERVVETDKSAG
jgi:sec-independent protein translocase protein TatA